jgi:hypothetical protein
VNSNTREARVEARLEESAMPYGTTLVDFRVEASLADGTRRTIVDVPLEFKKRAVSGADPAMVNISSTEPDFSYLFAPAAMAADASVEILPVNYADERLIQVSTEDEGIEISADGLLQGKYRGWVTARHYTDQAEHWQLYPMEVQVQPGRIAINSVVTDVYLNNPTTRIDVYGTHFDEGSVSAMRVNGNQVASFNIETPYKIHAEVATADLVSPLTVSLSTDQGEIVAPHSLPFQRDITLTESTLSFNAPVFETEYNPSNGQWLVSTFHATYVMEVVDGEWRTVASRDETIGSFEFMPGFREIVYGGPDGLHIADASTLEDHAMIPWRLEDDAFFSERSAVALLDHVLADGNVIIKLWDASERSRYVVYDPRTTRIQMLSISPYFVGSIQPHFKGFVILFNNNSSEETRPSLIYDPSTRAVEPLGDIGYVPSNRIAASANGERVLVRDEIYDQAMRPLLELSDSDFVSNVPALSPAGKSMYRIDVSAGIREVLAYELYQLDQSTSLPVEPSTTVWTDMDLGRSYGSRTKTQFSADGRWMLLSDATGNALERSDTISVVDLASDAAETSESAR